MVVPAGEGAALVVAQAELLGEPVEPRADLQAELGQPDQFGQRPIGEVGDPVAAWLRLAQRPLDDRAPLQRRHERPRPGRVGAQRPDR